MDIREIKENKLKTILQFSVPSIIAMLLQTAITITDGYFTGNYVGENALAAINLGLPILYFYLGVGLCVGVGGTVICGRLLGAEEKHKASEVFSQTVVTAGVICILTSVAVFLLLSPILKVLRADGELSGFFTQYYRIMLFTYPLMVAGTILGMFLRVDGKPQICMLVGILSCVLNAILDFLFVGRLSMGVQGSAIASLIVQIIGGCVQLAWFLRPSGSIGFRRFRFDKAVSRETILNGSSEFIGEMASAISMILFTIGFLFAVFFFILGKCYAGMFGCSEHVADMVSAGFRFYAVTFLFMGYDVINSMYFTSCGDARSSALISSLRGIILLLGFTFLFAALWGMTGVWLAAPATEVLTTMVSAWLITKHKKMLESR